MTKYRIEEKEEQLVPKETKEQEEDDNRLTIKSTE